MASQPIPGRTDDELIAFIAAAKERGIDDAFVVTLLRDNGWSKRRVLAAFASHYERTLPMPIPRAAGRTTMAAFAFLYIVNFVSLGFWTTSLDEIFDLLVSSRFSDPRLIQALAPLRSQIAWPIASVLVALPVFAFAHLTIANRLRRNPELYDAGVRLRLTYAALASTLLAVVVIAIGLLSDVIQNGFFEGFVLKTVVLVVLGGGVLGYYLATIEGPRDLGYYLAMIEGPRDDE